MCIEFKDRYECIDYQTYIMSADKYPCPCDRCRLNTNQKK